MFDVYLSDRRDHLLVVEKGQPISIHQHLGRWRKKRAAIAVSDEIKTAVQRDGYYSRRLREPHVPSKSKCCEQRGANAQVSRARTGIVAQTRSRWNHGS
jgi:hypothetical protein